MKDELYSRLSRREREIMDVIYAKGRATVSEVQEGMADPPSYSAIRATLRILEEKAALRHVEEGAAYVYLPTMPREKASKSALKRVVDTFFGGSPAKAMAALLEEDDALSDRDRKRLLEMVARAEKEGR